MNADRHRWFEIIAVLITGVLKFIIMDLLNHKFIFIAAAILFWSGYVIIKVSRDRSCLNRWGFTFRDFSKSFGIVLPVAFVCIAGMIIYARWQNIPLFNPHILPILILYPLWGFIQQFLVVGLVAGNLKDMERTRVSFLVIVLSTSVLFGLVHYPYTLLMIATFLLALFYSMIYLRYRNLITLGLFHGWLGCFFMFYVLNRDPWNEVFQNLK